ncbi:MAG: GNAT family N-acetyltransferase [Deltaproteobacteria bacterium]|nr:GNAT family N-acetyltransferase [Deltaproteobacteria bacterium]MCB9489885.1 GNAT family N-acetyltransferase [Deltaproteobacteria bacterium]
MSNSPIFEAPRVFATPRLELIAATPDLIRRDLEGREQLELGLSARVPQVWPPEFIDVNALHYTLEQLEADRRHVGWWSWYFVHRLDPKGRTVIGGGGYKGPPSPDGTVEIGYSLVKDYWRQGFGTEIARGLTDQAFLHPQVKRVTAETMRYMNASKRVLEKAGFALVGEGSASDILLFETLA